jgi:hypothetical protein
MLTISFALPENELTRIAIYNTIGEEVDVVREKDMLSLGRHTFFWNASDHPSGMYIIQVQSGSFTVTQKALLVK